MEKIKKKTKKPKIKSCGNNIIMYEQVYLFTEVNSDNHPIMIFRV